MRAIVAAAAFVGFLLVALAGAPPAAATAPSAISPGVTVTQTSTAIANDAIAGTFWHNTSLGPTGTNASSAMKIAVNVTGYTAMSSFSVLVTMSSGAYIPQVVATQGSTVLFNNTVQPQFTVNPTAGTTPVTLAVFALYTTGGAESPLGSYPVWANATATATLTNANSDGWVLSSSSFSISDTVTAPYGYYLNSTEIVFPWPGNVSVNYSSASASHGRFTPTYGALDVFNDSIAPAASFTTTASVEPLPITSGSAYIPLTAARRIPGSATMWTEFGNYTDGLGLPYASLYVLELDFPYTVDPSSVTVRAATHQLNRSAFSVGPSDVTILPGTLTVGAADTESFQVNLTSLVAPPQQSVAPGTLLFYAGSTAITPALIIIICMVLVLVYGGFAYSIHKREGKAKVRAVMGKLILLELALLAAWAWIAVMGASVG